ncbi:hypothetical protein [Pseudoneobacillus sp. C159]
MLIRITTAIVSTIVCFLYLAQPISGSIISNGIALYLVIIIFFGYLIFGIPVSYLIDMANRKIVIRSSIGRYFLNIVLYGVIGIMAFYMLLVILEGEIIIRDSSIWFGGFIPALIYYHVLLMLKGLIFIIQQKKNRDIQS